MKMRWVEMFKPIQAKWAVKMFVALWLQRNEFRKSLDCMALRNTAGTGQFARPA